MVACNRHPRDSAIVVANRRCDESSGDGSGDIYDIFVPYAKSVLKVLEYFCS